MNIVTVTAAQPCVQTIGHMTDDELIRQIEHAYPRLGPQLSTLVQRFKDAVDRLEGREPFPDFAPVHTSCPHCGSTLLLHSSDTQQQEHPNAS
jgi:hypothetical protein